MRKNIVKSYDMVEGSNDMSANITSQIVNVQNLDKASIHVNWSGTSPVGTITIEARNGENDEWYTLVFDDSIDITGNTGSHQIQFLELLFTDIRLVYTRTSGDGTMTARITAKTVGA